MSMDGWAEFFAARKQAGMGSFWLPPEIEREMPVPFICGMVCAAGPNLEPLACGYKQGHDGEHSWASLPTFLAQIHARCEPAPTLLAPEDTP